MYTGTSSDVEGAGGGVGAGAVTPPAPTGEGLAGEPPWRQTARHSASAAAGLLKVFSEHMVAVTCSGHAWQKPEAPLS